MNAALIEEVKAWIADDPDPVTAAHLQALLDADDEAALQPADVLDEAALQPAVSSLQPADVLDEGYLQQVAPETKGFRVLECKAAADAGLTR